MKQRWSLKLSLCSVAMFSIACANDSSEWSGPLPSPNGDQFVSTVYPLLLRDCAFGACHGAPERFFHVVGPGRARLLPTTSPDEPMTMDEVLFSYERARSMLATSSTLEQSLLLRKPLEPDAGGEGHTGVDDYGRNLFASQSDPGYIALSTWAHTLGAPPTAASVVAANAALAAPP